MSEPPVVIRFTEYAAKAARMRGSARRQADVYMAAVGALPPSDSRVSYWNGSTWESAPPEQYNADSDSWRTVPFVYVFDNDTYLWNPGTGLTVLGLGKLVVMSVAALPDVDAANGTSQADAVATLPTTCEVTLSDSSTVTLDVTDWQSVSPVYDGATEGAYPFVGAFGDLPDGIINPMAKLANVTVDVAAATGGTGGTGGSGGGSGVVTLRGMYTSYITGGSPDTVILPSGAQAGDIACIWAVNPYGSWNTPAPPAGWTVAYNDTGGAGQQAMLYGRLSADDIVAGSITLTAGGLPEYALCVFGNAADVPLFGYAKSKSYAPGFSAAQLDAGALVVIVAGSFDWQGYNEGSVGILVPTCAGVADWARGADDGWGRSFICPVVSADPLSAAEDTGPMSYTARTSDANASIQVAIINPAAS